MSSETINIFVDLDETLIHTLGMNTIAGELGDETNLCDKPTVVKLDDGDYHVLPRPGANYLLFMLREIGHVYMLTRASKDYARAMNKVFNLGFTEDRIFDREYVKKWKYKTPKIEIKRGKGFLIDDLDITQNFEKISFVRRFGTCNYIEVEPFFGNKNSTFTHSSIEHIVELITDA